ncbi:hypothetical protein CDL12_23017 [Handroanthus impetiginosus]|uniref:Uncharacterized protein n=1 Tax=Handroanthus impetiginosus TaxID=429701 RepID=A0A2G9GGL7_9LAMI|nr:hypothetical protein CDL12_23017 [Handroanthus impetiginosus]
MENGMSVPQPRLDTRFGVCDRVIFCHRRDFDPNTRWVYSLGRRPSDYSSGPRASDYSSSRVVDSRVTICSNEDYVPTDSSSMFLYSPMSYSAYAPTDDAYAMPGHSRYSLVANKQMVGTFLTVWVRSFLCWQRIDGLPRYHLTPGQKEGDELRRNADFMEILRKTRFPRVNGVNDEKSP